MLSSNLAIPSAVPFSMDPATLGPFLFGTVMVGLIIGLALIVLAALRSDPIADALSLLAPPRCRAGKWPRAANVRAITPAPDRSVQPPPHAA
jgi:hypothetical protein